MNGSVVALCRWSVTWIAAVVVSHRDVAALKGDDVLLRGGVAVWSGVGLHGLAAGLRQRGSAYGAEEAFTSKPDVEDVVEKVVGMVKE